MSRLKGLLLRYSSSAIVKKLDTKKQKRTLTLKVVNETISNTVMAQNFNLVRQLTSVTISLHDSDGKGSPG